MTEIIPAIIPKSFEDLNNRLAQVRGLSKVVQIDILDGTLVPEKSWPYIGGLDKEFLKIIKEEEGFPFWEDFNFEFDLMVADPSQSLQSFISAGANRIVVHYESFASREKALDFARKFHEQFNSGNSALDIELGLAFNIDTSLENLEDIVPHINFFQLMGIATIGRQGEPFDDRVLEKIKFLKSKYPDLPVSIDGGVDLDSAPKLVEAGANRLVSGHAVFGSEHIEETLESLRNL